jgi:hypothetical protein
MDRDKRPRRRLRHLRRDRALNSNQHRLYRHALARPEPEPEVLPEADGWESVRRNYAAWGCSAPPPTERKD